MTKSLNYELPVLDLPRSCDSWCYKRCAASGDENLTLAPIQSLDYPFCCMGINEPRRKKGELSYPEYSCVLLVLSPWSLPGAICVVLKLEKNVPATEPGIALFVKFR